jgi:hypothetical protein
LALVAPTGMLQLQRKMRRSRLGVQWYRK